MVNRDFQKGCLGGVAGSALVGCAGLAFLLFLGWEGLTSCAAWLLPSPEERAARHQVAEQEAVQKKERKEKHRRRRAERKEAKEQAEVRELEANGLWQRKDDRVDPMDDSPVLTLILPAEDDYVVENGRRHPRLQLHCRSDTTSVEFEMRGEAQPEADGSDVVHVQLSYDDAQERRVRTTMTNDRESLMLSSPITQIKEMLESETLRLEFTPLGVNPSVIAFDVRRLDVHIGPLREACGW